MQQPRASPSSPAGPRLWRPAAQRNVRNSWSAISRHLGTWTVASARGLTAATSVVNSILSQRYLNSMDFGVLKSMKDIRMKARKKLFLQGEEALMELICNYRELVESTSMMLRAKGSMRTYLKGPINGPLIEFSDQQYISEDTGDGDGMPVFSALSLSYHEKLAEELLNMFSVEIQVKWLIVQELHSILYSEAKDSIPNKKISEEMIQNILLEMQSKIPDFGQCQQHEMTTIVPNQSKPEIKREVLQVYLVSWLAEAKVKKSRKDEILKIVGEEIQASLSG